LLGLPDLRRNDAKYLRIPGMEIPYLHVLGASFVAVSGGKNPSYLK